MENVHSTFSSSSLLCEESQACFNEYGKEEDDDYVQCLLDREITSVESSQFISSNWLKEARSAAIAYILDKRASLGFKFQTAYLSVTYLDRFLSRRLIDGEKYWAVRLLAMACLVLAAKMEECVVPPLSEFPTEEYNFGSRVIQRMELLVLSTLAWKIKSVTPFDFVHYFVSKFPNDLQSQSIASGAAEAILGAIRDVNLMSYRPSVIAAAATLITMGPNLTKEALELKVNDLSSSRFPSIQDVWPCYNQLKNLGVEGFKSSKCIVSPPFSPIELQRIKNAEASSSTFALGDKRKRLGFEECDQDWDVPDLKRRD